MSVESLQYLCINKVDDYNLNINEMCAEIKLLYFNYLGYLYDYDYITCSCGCGNSWTCYNMSYTEEIEIIEEDEIPIFKEERIPRKNQRKRKIYKPKIKNYQHKRRNNLLK